MAVDARLPRAVRGSDVVAALRSPRRLKTESLAGLVVALALIPEAISFSIIAGVDPRVGLFASFTMAVTIAIVGGRPAMISAATGAVALVVAPIAREHGLDYLLATVILAGVLQIVLSALGVAKLMRFIPRSVMVGFDRGDAERGGRGDGEHAAGEAADARGTRGIHPVGHPAHPLRSVAGAADAVAVMPFIFAVRSPFRENRYHHECDWRTANSMPCPWSAEADRRIRS